MPGKGKGYRVTLLPVNAIECSTYLQTFHMNFLNLKNHIEAIVKYLLISKYIYITIWVSLIGPYQLPISLLLSFLTRFESISYIKHYIHLFPVFISVLYGNNSYNQLTVIGITLKDESNNVIVLLLSVLRLQPLLSVCGTVSGFKAKHNKTKIPMTTKFSSAHSLVG